MTTLENALVVVTGGGTGFGRAIALEAARRGARILIAEIGDASSTVAEAQALGAQADWLQTDVSDYESVTRLVKRAEELGGANVVVNNAMFAVNYGALHDADPVTAMREITVNFGGYFNVIHAFAPSLIAKAEAGERAYILNVGSEHSLAVPPQEPGSVYTSCKYGVLGLTDTARRDYMPYGVGVTMAAPGHMRTESYTAYAATAAPEDIAWPESRMEDPADVAIVVLDGLLEGRYIIVTNPDTVGFAREHAHAMLAEIDRAPGA